MFSVIKNIFLFFISRPHPAQSPTPMDYFGRTTENVAVPISPSKAKFSVIVISSG